MPSRHDIMSEQIHDKSSESFIGARDSPGFHYCDPLAAQTASGAHYCNDISQTDGWRLRTPGLFACKCRDVDVGRGLTRAETKHNH